jgi:Mobilization protein NikA
MARVRAEYEAKRARGETGAPSASETLAELERDQRTGRTVKHDWRCSPEEKARLYEAAAAAGLSSSEFLRTAVSKACDDVLTGERV